jgi:hypothetical protein
MAKRGMVAKLIARCRSNWVRIQIFLRNQTTLSKRVANTFFCSPEKKLTYIHRMQFIEVSIIISHLTFAFVKINT